MIANRYWATPTVYYQERLTHYEQRREWMKLNLTVSQGYMEAYQHSIEEYRRWIKGRV